MLTNPFTNHLFSSVRNQTTKTMGLAGLKKELKKLDNN
jgi:hypothetical protein